MGAKKEILPIKVYDLGPGAFDRYTVVYVQPVNCAGTFCYQYVGMSEHPFHPQGFGQHGESSHRPIDWKSGRHLGKRIAFDSLPADCQALVRQDLVNLK